MKMKELQLQMLNEKADIRSDTLSGTSAEQVIRQNTNLVRLYEAQIKQAAHNLKAGKKQILDL